METFKVFLACFQLQNRCNSTFNVRWQTSAGSAKIHAQSKYLLLTTQSRSQSFVPLDQRSGNESSGSNHFEITMGNDRILVIQFTAQSQSASISCYGACLKWLLPELSFSDRWSRGTKLWERDCSQPETNNVLSRFSLTSILCDFF